MAVPLLVWPLLSAALTWLGNFLVRLVDWGFRYWKFVKVAALSIIVLSCIRGAIAVYNWISARFGLFSEGASSSLSGFTSGGSDASFLSLLNAVLPISECFGFLTAYLGVLGSVLVWRFICSMYSKIPLKNT